MNDTPFYVAGFLRCIRYDAAAPQSITMLITCETDRTPMNPRSVSPLKNSRMKRRTAYMQIYRRTMLIFRGTQSRRTTNRIVNRKRHAASIP